MITIQLYLAVHDSWVPATTATRNREELLDVDSCSISIIIEGTEHLLGLWNLGRIDLIVAQAEDCVQRLTAGGPAILRSAVLDRQHVPFHLFEPPEVPGGQAHITRFFADGSPAEHWFPLPDWGLRDPVVLFEWVAANRTAITTSTPPDDQDDPPMVRVPVDIDRLISELAGLARTGQTVLDLAQARADELADADIDAEAEVDAEDSIGDSVGDDSVGDGPG